MTTTAAPEGSPALPHAPPPAHAHAHPHAHPPAPTPRRVALMGNPNTGKTTLFNRLTGLRHKTANFPGTTLEARVGRFRTDGHTQAPAPGSGDCAGPHASLPAHASTHDAHAWIDLIDLPGIYSLELDQKESQVCRDALAGVGLSGASPAARREPDALCIVVDATNLARNLRLVGEALRRRLPTVVALNMVDVAHRRGLRIDALALAQALACPVVPICARSGEGLPELRRALAGVNAPPVGTPPGSEGDGQAGLIAWADRLYALAASAPDAGLAPDTLTDRLDRAFTHPLAGTLIFAGVMAGLFYAIFSLAQHPMGWIDAVFALLNAGVEAVTPPGLLRELLGQGVVSGIGATVIFLPQICLLFFLISLLEDTGYLARAAFVLDRVLRPFGLPGHAFVPLLSSHACAIPGIMATRAIPDPRERLATILVAPFMSCSARLPVYVLLTTFLFPDAPAQAALAFVGCYALGIAAGVLSALLARRTILRGKARPMALELPGYKWPSLRTALITTYDRGMTFLRKAGTMILAASIVLWWLGAFPKVEPPAQVAALRAQAESLRTTTANPAEPAATPEAPAATTDAPPTSPDQLDALADRLEARDAKARSFIGRLGQAAAPVFAPIGADWQLTVGILASFAAREVFAATMAVVITGDEDFESEGVVAQLAAARRDDPESRAPGTLAPAQGPPLFDAPTSWAMLVFFVLAMQCLTTLVVTARESGHIKWALLQLAWMSLLAYGGALAAHRIASAVAPAPAADAATALVATPTSTPPSRPDPAPRP